jgi:hypothetical protein
VDVEDLDGIALENKVALLPTFIVFRRGEHIGQYCGSDANKLKALLDNYICTKEHTQ